MRTQTNDTTCASDPVEIDAPADFVWGIVVDFARYPEWNPFCVAIDGTLELGSPVVLHTPHPDRPGEELLTQEWISAITPLQHLQYNTGDSIPGVHAVRDQWIDVTGDHTCRYQTVDVFTGEHAQLAYDLQGQWVTDGFNALAQALKARAEQQWAQHSS